MRYSLTCSNRATRRRNIYSYKLQSKKKNKNTENELQSIESLRWWADGSSSSHIIHIVFGSQWGKRWRWHTTVIQNVLNINRSLKSLNMHYVSWKPTIWMLRFTRNIKKKTKKKKQSSSYMGFTKEIFLKNLRLWHAGLVSRTFQLYVCARTQCHSTHGVGSVKKKKNSRIRQS